MPCQLDQMCAFGEFFGGKGIWKDKGFDFFKDENHLFFVVKKKHFEGLISKIITAKKLKKYVSVFFEQNIQYLQEFKPVRFICIILFITKTWKLFLSFSVSLKDLTNQS